MENDDGESGGGIEFTGEVQSVGDDDLGLGFDRHLPHHIISVDGVIENNVATLHSLAEAKGLSIRTGGMASEMIDGARSILYFRNIVGGHEDGSAKGTDGTVVGEVVDVEGRRVLHSESQFTSNVTRGNLHFWTIAVQKK